MNIVEINILDSGSTGKIMRQIAQCARKRKYNVYTVSNIGVTPKSKLAYRNDGNHFYVDGFLSFALHYKLGGFLGLNGLMSFFSTLRLIFFLKEKKVDLIHLHNLHNFCFNLPLLFWYIKKNDISVVWTLHDCWSFTGRCPHFILIKCDKWKSGCHNCPYPRHSYPHSYVDTSKIMWKIKKKLFTGINKCILVTPSRWLADLVKQSYLKDYPVKVINNGIDLSVFKPTESDFREKYNLKKKKIVLGVAFGWGIRKGLDVFVELARRLSDDYQIILVGTDDGVDKQLPANIISIHRTRNQVELAQIYSAADVFANPTREENYPTVNMESIACGTPVVSFRTGGSPEILDEKCGFVVECGDINAMEFEIRRICESRPFTKESCLNHGKSFDMNARFEDYVELYNSMI